MTAKERDVVRGNNKWKGGVAGLSGLTGPVGVPPFNFCHSVYTLCPFWNECLISSVPLCCRLSCFNALTQAQHALLRGGLSCFSLVPFV